MSDSKNSKPWSGFLLSVLIWSIPFVALLSVGYLYYSWLSDRGPLIEIRFSEAPGLEEDSTPLQFRGIEVGKVESLRLSEDDSQIVVGVRLRAKAQDLARGGSRFWIVRPQMSFSGIKGLETIMRGAYIRMEVGSGETMNEFEGDIEKRDASADGESVHFKIISKRMSSLGPKDPVTYRGVEIGVVSKVYLSYAGDEVVTEISIPVANTRFIRSNTVFWEKKAISADIGLFGSEIDVSPIESLIRGGLSLATPSEAKEIAKAGAEFRLIPEPPESWTQWSPKLTFED